MVSADDQKTEEFKVNTTILWKNRSNAQRMPSGIERSTDSHLGSSRLRAVWIPLKRVRGITIELTIMIK